jgi:hypothetical protein
MQAMGAGEKAASTAGVSVRPLFLSTTRNTIFLAIRFGLNERRHGNLAALPASDAYPFARRAMSPLQFFSLLRVPPAALAAALSASVFAAPPPAIPPLRPGLWEATTVPAGRPQPRAGVTRVCLDKHTQGHVLAQLTMAMPRMCSRNQLAMRGGRFVTDSSCTFGASTIEGRTETTFFRDTAYRMEVVGRVGPTGQLAPMQKAVIDGRYAGSCPKGMKPGDMVLPNGLTLNLVQMSAMLGR